jgi:hypothetical protein
MSLVWRCTKVSVPELHGYGGSRPRRQVIERALVDVLDDQFLDGPDQPAERALGRRWPQGRPALPYSKDMLGITRGAHSSGHAFSSVLMR